MIRGCHYRTGQAVEVEAANGLIAAIRPIEGGAEPLPWLGPGLVDLQVNGFGGRDFNASPPEPGATSAITRLLLADGVTTFLPTVITASDEAIEGALEAISHAVGSDELAARCVAGIHLEGPFIAAEDGPRGAHNVAWVKAPDWNLFVQWQRAARGLIRLVTLAPELPGACEFIRHAVASGVRCAIGHTAATPEQIRDAVAAGATLSTHFGNGCHLHVPRHPNYLWEQLATDELWASLIADSFHLPDAVMKSVMRVKRTRAFLVSDAVAQCGLPAGEYRSSVGGQVRLEPDGRLYMVHMPELQAGAARTLRQGVGHIAAAGLAGLPSAWEMASTRPARYLGLKQAAGLRVGAPADLVLFDATRGEISVRRVYKAGVDVT